MNNLILRDKKVIDKRTFNDKAIGHTGGLWYDCYYNEYVDEEGVIYRMSFEKVTVDCYHVNCPVCGWFEGSEYLGTVFNDDDKKLWLANMVTHMRHTTHKEGHEGLSSSYEKTWGRGGYGWNKLSSETHDTTKLNQNEVEKRRMVKDERFLKFLTENEFKSSDILFLENTTEETSKVWKKILGE